MDAVGEPSYVAGSGTVDVDVARLTFVLSSWRATRRAAEWRTGGLTPYAAISNPIGSCSGPYVRSGA